MAATYLLEPSPQALVESVRTIPLRTFTLFVEKQASECSVREHAMKQEHGIEKTSLRVTNQRQELSFTNEERGITRAIGEAIMGGREDIVRQVLASLEHAHPTAASNAKPKHDDHRRCGSVRDADTREHFCKRMGRCSRW